jgi:hypothetical protein
VAESFDLTAAAAADLHRPGLVVHPLVEAVRSRVRGAVALTAVALTAGEDRR